MYSGWLYTSKWKMNEQIIWNFFYEKLNNPYGTAALMGNLYVESKLNPKDLEDSYARKFKMTDEEYTNAVDSELYTREQFTRDNAGYGLVQWTYWSRKGDLYDYARSVSKSIGDLDMQLDFIWIELQKYKPVINALYEAKDIRTTSDIVALKYEKPYNTAEEYLANRAKYGQKLYDAYAKEVTDMAANTWSKVNSMLSEWKSKGLSKPEIVVNLANACIGWNYAFGDRGEQCIPNHIKSRISSLAGPYPKESESLKKRCPVANGAGTCSGCKFYPGGVTLAFDCRGFTYWCFLKAAGIAIGGGGCTSQYNNNSNWEEKGPISKMPKDKVCCTFRYDSSTQLYEHTLIYDGKGNYIHCSGEVKKVDISKYKATHYAIPKGLYSSSNAPTGGVTIVGQAKVYVANQGSTSTVNMRSQADISSSILSQIKIGTIVDVVEKGTNWTKITFNGKTGYMMTKYLVDVNNSSTANDSVDYVKVSRKDLETIYSMIGKMLK